MKNGKAIFLSFLFLFCYTFISWFFINFPYQKFEQYQNILPQIINKNFIRRFPEDLVVSIEKGFLDINRPSPYCLVLEDQTNIGIVFDTDTSNQLVDTFNQDGPYSHLCYPVLLIGNNFILSQNSDTGKYNFTQISKDISLIINKNLIVSSSEQVLPIMSQLGKILYYLAPFIIFTCLFIFTLTSNLIYSFAGKLILKVLKTNLDPIRGTIYGTSLFVLTLLQFLNFIVFGWIINRDLGQNYSLSFPFSKTIITALGTLIYFKCLRDRCKTLFSTTPIYNQVKQTQNIVNSSIPPNHSQTSNTTTPDPNSTPPPRKVHIDLTIPAKPLLGNDPNPSPHQV